MWKAKTVSTGLKELSRPPINKITSWAGKATVAKKDKGGCICVDIVSQVDVQSKSHRSMVLSRQFFLSNPPNAKNDPLTSAALQAYLGWFKGGRNRQLQIDESNHSTSPEATSLPELLWVSVVCPPMRIMPLLLCPCFAKLKTTAAAPVL